MRILFVDDDSAILEHLEALLEPMKDTWGLEFVSSGKAALDALDRTPTDAVVADMEMPEMNGVQLLEEVKERFPGTLRLVLSAHQSYKEALRAIGTAHHFMVKPVKLDVLKKVVDEAVALKTLLSSGPLQELTSSIGTLPTIPALYQKVMKEVRQEEPSLQKVASIISQDPSMTATILRLINSSHFGMSRRIKKIGDALGLLGLKTVQSLILSSHVFRELDPAKCPEVNGDALWQHSFLMSTYAKAIAEAERASDSEVNESQMAGLLHATGILILSSKRPEDYARAVRLAGEKSIPRAEAEREVFGCTHGEVGGYLMGLWGIPEGVVAALAYHHRLGSVTDGSFSPLAAVHVAEVLADRSMAESVGAAAAKLDEASLSSLNLKDRLPDWEKRCERVGAKAE